MISNKGGCVYHVAYVCVANICGNDSVCVYHVLRKFSMVANMFTMLC